MSSPTIIKHDELYRFLFDEHDVRGELVSISDTYQALLKDRNYPLLVQKLIGELLVITSLLTATLKFEGDVTVQLQGNGPLNFIVIHGDHHQHFRGLARINSPIADNTTLPEMMGKGLITITLSPKQGERYQGIVALEKETLSACVENYFYQSEQLPTKIFTYCDPQNQFVAGLLLQHLPGGEQDTIKTLEHLSILAETLTIDELKILSPQDVLYRLYHQEILRLFEPQPVCFQCTCSRQKCISTLLTLPSLEIDNILQEDGHIDLMCDYCGNHYPFDSVDIKKIRIKHNQSKLQKH